MEELSNCPISNLHDAFETFKTSEPRSWIESGTSTTRHESPELLVRPSGNLKSPIAHRLNQPSFTTKYLENGETADRTNGCIAMVMGNAYQPGETLLFDHIHRREARSEAIEKYPSNVLQCHEDFTSAIAQSMQAKVEIVYGQKVQSRLLQTQAIQILPLWGKFEGLILFLALEKGYSNQDSRFQLRRIMLMASHPQHIFYCARNSDTTLHQEKIMEAATLMTNNAVPWVDGYFTQKKWLRIIPGILEKQEIKAFGEVLRRAQKMPPANISERSYGGGHTVKDYGAEVIHNDSSPSLSEAGSWALYFQHKSHSNEALREYIPPAKEALSDWKSFDVWVVPTDLPSAVLEWFQGQKHIIFANQPISNFEDVSDILMKLLGIQEILSVEESSNWPVAIANGASQPTSHPGGQFTDPVLT
ncbi:Hypothetical protein PENO1_021470 [Penicillium occitanis (nom. inval.)]|nr:Hypothetical protein PENO1_021470 [Penicillium occitanis (nom. inval.)]PCH06208.1 hypothetical protein PENOC_024850 [Penicillium occitanis (nom. inval.)]